MQAVTTDVKIVLFCIHTMNIFYIFGQNFSNVSTYSNDFLERMKTPEIISTVQFYDLALIKSRLFCLWLFLMALKLKLLKISCTMIFQFQPFIQEELYFCQEFIKIFFFDSCFVLAPVRIIRIDSLYRVFFEASCNEQEIGRLLSKINPL